MGGFFDAVDLGGMCGKPDDAITDGGLATGIAVTMKQGEQKCTGSGVQAFAAKEYALPGDECIFEDHVGIRVSHFEATLIHFTFSR
jgi:hypothetical protein